MTFDPLDAVLFDLDGVLTPTAEVHMRAWSRLFTPYLLSRGVAPYTDADYFTFIDGKPRYEGVRSLLADRGIVLPYGEPSDDPSTETVCGLGNRKNAAFTEVLNLDGVAPYPGSLAFLAALDACSAAGRTVHTAVVSSSRNARAVLTAAGLIDRFEVIIDGVVAADHHIAGKPAPDTYRYAAEQVGVAVSRAVVVEDATSGVAAGRAGGFGHVLGVNRGAGRQALIDHGADIVVDDLAELVPDLEQIVTDHTETPR